MSGKKARRLLAALCLLCSAGWARGGIMAGQGGVRHITTAYFDIIFPETSERTALRLAEQADGIYEELCAALGTQARFSKLPVVLSAGSDYPNAYYSGVPYNHILLIDTRSDETLAVLEDDLLETFRHELTHAVTYNHVQGKWRLPRALICDAFSLSPLTVPTMLAEGAAVAAESAGDGGRLHDGFFLHTVRQAKVQGAFPGFADVAGSRDTFPAGISYGFGAPFVAWLQETYGTERSMDWWYACLTGHGVLLPRTYSGYFKKTYGISLKEAWETFRDSVAVPDIPPSPLQETGVRDFFTGSTDGFSRKNRAGSRYLHLTACRDGFACLDEAAATVLFVQADAHGTVARPRRLFRKEAVSALSLSADGRFLAVSSYAQNGVNWQNRTEVYDMERGAWLSGVRADLRSAAVVRAEDGWYLAGVRTRSQDAWLAVYRIDVPEGAKKRSATLLPVANEPLGGGAMVLSLCDAGDGSLAAIRKDGLTWSLRKSQPLSRNGGANGLGWTEYALPREGMRLRSLSGGTLPDGTAALTFSWACEDTFPRYGRLETDGARFVLQDADVSGGVYCPVQLGERVFYAGYFVQDYKLLVQDAALLPAEVAAAPSRMLPQGTITPGAESGTAARSGAPAGEPYRSPFPLHGLLLPLAVAPEYDTDLYAEDLLLFPGLTWLTTNPWDSAQLTVSAGYAPWERTGGLSVTLSGGTGALGTQLFSYAVQPTALFDAEGFLQATADARVQLQFRVGTHDTLSFAVHGIGGAVREGGDVILRTAESASVGFSTIHKTGSSRYEQGGISVQAAWRMNLQSATGIRDVPTHQIIPTVGVRLPRLLPFSCTGSVTYNLPLSLSASLVPSSDILLSARAEAVLCAVEVQRGLSWLPLYCNRLEATLAYTGSLTHRNGDWELFRSVDGFRDAGLQDYRDAITLSLLLTGTVNTGILCRLPLTVGVSSGYRPHRDAGQSAWFAGLAATASF